jgi:hypothetical protein
MDSSYKLKNKKIFELAEFPQLNDKDKMVVLFSGGIKSTLVALIAKELYGIENIIFGFISMDAFGDFKKNNSKKLYSKKNYEDGFKRLGGINKFDIGNDSFTVHKQMHLEHNKKILRKFSSVKYSIAGYSKIHEETMEMLTESGWGKGLITQGQLPAYVKSNSKKYETLNYAIENFDLPIPFTNNMVEFNELQKSFYSMVRPFRNLDDAEIIQLYVKMNLLDKLYQTKSCDVSENEDHCGNCRNCQERKKAFSQAKISDITKYSFN